ncbi:malate dehydrogenase [Parabacteroides sp. 52]|uniref:malate dehydrogenase n=1 Tax=unclassified Parabacteroides TaxID=2649774 RepID=UPI0013D76C23|nr:MULTISPECIES: malate dehydrogenase [unclassified Parabacteroides]MDH6535293.1 malate dehydrogenase [Parabacteroides sp. PM5-20]NDV55856.1 malate dehydrogenase [Parabacteroides sp. 52]
MKFLTSEKLTIIGAAGMIGSNMAQSAVSMGLSSNICLYDPYKKGLEGVAEELLQCGFNGVDINYTDRIEEALKDSKYIITSGGAARKEGMTREDLLKGNAEVAIQLGKDIKQYAPDVKHIVVVFNPADITGLLVLLYAGLKPSQVSTLAALDSTRLRNELAKHLYIHPDKIMNCRTYGGHGEQMAVFSSTATVDGQPLNSLIGTSVLADTIWQEIKERVVQGGKRIIELRGRSSFQSPAYLSLEMIRAVMGGPKFDWPVGVYVSNKDFSHIMMAMETRLDKEGVHYQIVEGTPDEQEALKQSYGHLCRLRDSLIQSGVIPPMNEWSSINPNL